MTNKSNTARAKRNFTGTPVWEVQIFDGKRITDSITVIGSPRDVAQKMLDSIVNESVDNYGAVTIEEINAAKARASEQVQLKRVGVV